jgi:hypothetical protein
MDLTRLDKDLEAALVMQAKKFNVDWTNSKEAANRMECRDYDPSGDREYLIDNISVIYIRRTVVNENVVIFALEVNPVHDDANKLILMGQNPLKNASNLVVPKKVVS